MHGRCLAPAGCSVDKFPDGNSQAGCPPAGPASASLSARNDGRRPAGGGRAVGIEECAVRQHGAAHSELPVGDRAQGASVRMAAESQKCLAGTWRRRVAERQRSGFQIPLIHPPATAQDSQLPQNLKDLLASDSASVTLGRLLGMVLSGVSLGERQDWLL